MQCWHILLSTIQVIQMSLSSGKQKVPLDRPASLDAAADTGGAMETGPKGATVSADVEDAVAELDEVSVKHFPRLSYISTTMGEGSMVLLYIGSESWVEDP